ncbi:hypothetical protein Tco_0034276 [Tanacetum coccineum]
MIRCRAETNHHHSQLHLPLPTSSPPLQLLSSNRRKDMPEITLPPRKRLGVDLGPRYKIREGSFAAPARPIGGRRADYGFVGTMDTEIRRQRAEEVAMGLEMFEEQDTQGLSMRFDGSASMISQLAAADRKESSYGRDIQRQLGPIKRSAEPDASQGGWSTTNTIHKDTPDHTSGTPKSPIQAMITEVVTVARSTDTTRNGEIAILQELVPEWLVQSFSLNALPEGKRLFECGAKGIQEEYPKIEEQQQPWKSGWKCKGIEQTDSEEPLPTPKIDEPIRDPVRKDQVFIQISLCRSGVSPVESSKRRHSQVLASLLVKLASYT